MKILNFSMGMCSLLASVVACCQGDNVSSKNFLVSADPAAVQLSPLNTCVVVIDMENDFCSKGGMFDRAGIDITPIQQAITPMANVLTAARGAGFKIIYLKMGFKDDLSDIGKEGSPNRRRHLQLHVGDTITSPNGTRSRILIRNNWGTEIVPPLQPQNNDIVLYKTRFGGFYNTELDSILKKNSIQNIVLVGCTTSVCIMSTAMQAMFEDYSPIVLKDCSANPGGLLRSNQESSILTIQTLLGSVSTSNDFIKAIKNSRSSKD